MTQNGLHLNCRKTSLVAHREGVEIAGVLSGKGVVRFLIRQRRTARKDLADRGNLERVCGVRFLTGAARKRNSARRRGFSLAELIVSIGLLGLMLSLAGKIFSLSIQSTGQATSLIDVSKSLRLLEESLRNDLCGVDPDRSMLIIQGNPIDAYWTADDAAVDGDDMPTNGSFPHAIDAEREDLSGDLVQPRADVLMMFTSRPTTSFSYPGVRSNLAQVVYGHAELGELKSDGSWGDGPDAPVAFPADDTTYFSRPAEGWHLARRSVALIDSPVATLVSLGLVDASLAPPESPDEGTMEPYPLSDGEIDFIVQPPSGKLFFHGDVLGGTPWTNMFLPNWYRRSRLDVTPPARSAVRLGHYFLPKCASFKVEWTPIGPGRLAKFGGINLREMLWIDPGVPDDAINKIGNIRARIFEADNSDPRLDQLDDELLDNGVDLLDELKVLEDRITAGTATAGTRGWFARDPEGGGSDAPDPLWPTALRVTVDVFDDTGKFTRPVHHVMVIPVGNDR